MLAIFSRLGLLLGTFFLGKQFTPGEQFNSFVTYLISLASRWDGPHYIFIAQNGYVTTGVERFFIVFPPFYPLVIRSFNIIFNNPSLTAVIISNVLFVAACLVFYKLLRLDYSQDFSLFVVFLVCIFPTSYFFSAAYAESLFFLLFCLAMLSARKNQFLGAGLFAGLAVLTKPFGLIIWSAILIEWFINNKKIISLLTIFILMIVSGGIYLLLNFYLFGNFFAFQKFLEENWYKTFAWPWTGILESFKRGVSTPEWSSYKIYAGLAETIVSILSWLLVLFGLTKRAKIRFSYAVCSFLGVLFFTSTSFILSSPRYLLSIPPIFILLGRIFNQKILKVLWAVLSITLLFYLSGVFATGRWAF